MARGGRGASKDGMSRPYERRAGLWEDLSEVAMLQADILLLMLLAEAALLPLAVLWGDIALVLVYAAALSLVCFVALFLAVPRMEARATRLRAQASERVTSASRRPPRTRK